MHGQRYLAGQALVYVRDVLLHLPDVIRIVPDSDGSSSLIADDTPFGRQQLFDSLFGIRPNVELVIRRVGLCRLALRVGSRYRLVDIVATDTGARRFPGFVGDLIFVSAFARRTQNRKRPHDKA